VANSSRAKSIEVRPRRRAIQATRRVPAMNRMRPSESGPLSQAQGEGDDEEERRAADAMRWQR
jgi:hypothetical protein